MFLESEFSDLVWLVPNHLSTHKLNKNQAPYHTRIRYYSLLFHCFFLFCPTTRVEEKEKSGVEMVSGVGKVRMSW